jgi:hypothetical protein
MTLPNNIHAFLDEFGQALKLPGRRRRRVLDEAHDHLLEATERRIAMGMDPSVAEMASVEAFGDPVAVASRFDPGRLWRLRRAFWGAMDRFDRWHADHIVAGAAVLLAPVAVLVAVLWSPVPALGFLGPFMVLVWIGKQLEGREEPSYRHRLWGWKQHYPTQYQVVTNVGSLLGTGLVIGLLVIGGLPHVSPWLVPALVPFYPLIWILSMPRRYESRPESAG